MVQNVISSTSSTVADCNKNKNVHHSFYLRPFLEQELLCLLNKKLKCKQSSGPDEIPGFVIKNVLHLIIEPLAFLINLSFSTGTFPERLKIGKVVPVYKKGNQHLFENYRPVTVINSFSKIFEYAFLDRLLNFLNCFEILDDRQHGFCQDKSVSTALFSFYNQIIEDMENGGCPVAVFCDLSRAFDCVNHSKLLSKVQDYGIRGIPLQWIGSYLTNRKQLVSVNYHNSNVKSNFQSEPLNVSMGVPQGSVLGPILFILYINDFNLSIQNVQHVAYADDFSLIVTGNRDNLVSICGEAIFDATCCFTNHDLFFNIKKTNMLQFHQWQNPLEPIVLSVEQENLKSTANCRFLGVNVDENLSWKHHCNELISNLNSLTYLILNLRTVLERNQLVSIYYAHVDSRLRFGICLWGQSTLAKKVFTSQKRIVRRIAGVNDMHSCRPLFMEYKILPLVCVYIFEICTYIFSRKKEFLLNRDIHNINTRNRNQIHRPFARCRTTTYAPNYIGPVLFNKLPLELKNSSDIGIFKKKLKGFLLGKCYYTLDEFLD